MREIKFRGKSKKNDEWFEGDLIKKHGINGLYYTIETLFGGLSIVETDSIGQYTGVHDETDEEIEVYENDIVEFKYEDNTYRGFIKFEAGAFIIACDELEDSYITLLDIMNSDGDYYWINGTVIGNLYE